MKLKNYRILNSNKVRVKIKAVGLCASDIPRAYENGAYKYPLVMGHEISGKIFESNFKNFRKMIKYQYSHYYHVKNAIIVKKKIIITVTLIVIMVLGKTEDMQNILMFILGI